MTSMQDILTAGSDSNYHVALTSEHLTEEAALEVIYALQGHFQIRGLLWSTEDLWERVDERLADLGLKLPGTLTNTDIALRARESASWNCGAWDENGVDQWNLMAESVEEALLWAFGVDHWHGLEGVREL